MGKFLRVRNNVTVRPETAMHARRHIDLVLLTDFDERQIQQFVLGREPQ